MKCVWTARPRRISRTASVGWLTSPAVVISPRRLRRHLSSRPFVDRRLATGLSLSTLHGWLGSRVVSVLDSGAEGPGFKSQSRRCRVTVLGKLFSVHTHRAFVHQATKLVAALLRVAWVNAGLGESINGSLPPGLWLTSPAGWLP